MMENILPVGKLEMSFLNDLLVKYTGGDARIKIGARVGEDAAVVDVGDRYLVSKTNPITFATNEIGWYVVNVCVNNLVVRGVRPRWMLNCVLLPEGKTTPRLVEDIFRQIYEAGQGFGVAIIGGHTEVTYGLDRPLVIGHMMGEVAPDDLVTVGGVRVGDTVLMTKALGVEGTAIIAGEMGDRLRRHGYDDAFISQAQSFLYDPGISVYEEALTAARSGYVTAMTDATEGGLATTLHQLAGAAGVGVLIEAEKVPILPETARLCATFDLDPFGLISSGLLIMTAPADKVEALQQEMAAAGLSCAPIGVITPVEDGCRVSRAGQVADLPYFANDELTRIL